MVKKIYKNYFCYVQNNQALDNFIDSFANKTTPHDGLQNLVLLFFNLRDGNLVPNKTPSSLMNYIDVAHLGAMMRIIEQYNDPKELVEKLQDYLLGLNLRNRITGEFLDQESFKPLLVDLSESLMLTQGKNIKYSHRFFENILHGCICSRLHTIKDIEDYCNGFFVHVTDDLIDKKKKEFSCCLNKQPSSDDEEKYEKEEDWQSRLEEEYGHEESYDFETIADEMVSVQNYLICKMRKRKIQLKQLYMN